RVLILDRYEIGERQTSACATPTEWLNVLGLRRSRLQTFDELVVNTPHTKVGYQLPYTFSTFDYPTLCSLLAEQSDAEFEIAAVQGRRFADPGGRGAPIEVETDRGTVSAPLVVDALGWKRV